jgi:hypothetical protein
MLPSTLRDGAPWGAHCTPAGSTAGSSTRGHLWTQAVNAKLSAQA